MKGYLHRENSFFETVCRPSLVVAKHENISECAVPMEITEEEYISAFQCLLHHQLSSKVFREGLTAGSNPLTVQILPN